MKTPLPLSNREMIETSVSCFWLGLVGLVPVLGIPFALAALFKYRVVKAGEAGRWNPARRYLLFGVWGARLGLWPLLIGGIVALLINLFL